MKPASVTNKTVFFLLAALILSVSVLSPVPQVFAQETVEEPKFYMGIQILESQQQVILDSIKKVKELQLGNMVILHPMDQAWNLTHIEEAIKTADNLGLYVIFETFNFSDHAIRVSPEQFSEWQSKYPRLLGILVQEVSGKQVDLNLWLDNATGTVSTRLEAEEAIIENITSSMKLEEFKQNGATIFLQENVVSYASANTSFCDVLITKCFNAPNTELMIGLTRGMANSYNISEWGLWVDTWREWIEPPAFTANDVERALYEGWFYGAKYFFFEQGNFFGTLNRDWPTKFIILDENGELTEYGKVIQSFYIFLQNQNNLEIDQPTYNSSIAIMLGQSGWASRGKDWGLWEQSQRQGDFDYELLNIFFPGIGDNWQIGSALTGKEFTGLPLGMVDVISIYAPASVLKQYDVIIGLGWSQISDTIASNIEEYVENGGVFFSLLTFTHGNEYVDDLEDPYAWTEGFASLFGVEVMSPEESMLDISADGFLHEVTFTDDTFWYPWSGKTYSYVDQYGAGSWFWKFKYTLSSSENTRVIAWIDGKQTAHNAFIIENKKGSGYTYIVNTRNPNSLPNGVLTNVLTNFIYFLCAHYVEPTTYLVYPENEYWLSQGQANGTVYLLHDNSTDTHTFTYSVDAPKTSTVADQKYLVFEYLNKERYGTAETDIVNLDVTLNANEAKLFILTEDTGEPQVLYSGAVLDESPSFENQRLTVSLSGVEGSENVTKIYCSQLEAPTYILGVPFETAQDYDTENKILTVASSSDIIVGWENTTDVSVVESSAVLSSASWNSTLGTLTVATDGTTGQQTTLQLQTNGTTPYYVKLDGTETSDWSYDNSTGLLSTSFTLSSDSIEVVFGFKPIMVDFAVVSDDRADVGSVQTVGVHVAWMGNGSDIKGASVFVNGTEYVTNRTGWASFEVSSDVVGKTVWNIMGIKYEDYSVFAKAVSDPQIVWDRINITDTAVIEGLIQSGTQQTVWLTAEYEYDSEVFDYTKGTMYLNNEPMTWSSQNMRWEQTVTSTVVGPQNYEATTVDDETFGLTVVHTNGMTTTITWDKVEIAKTEFDTTTIGETVVRVYVAYSYNQTSVTNAEVTVNGKACTETEHGIYTCKLSGFSPLEGFLIEVNTADFEQATASVSSIQFSNTLLYSLILAAATFAVVFVVNRKRNNKKQA